MHVSIRNQILDNKFSTVDMLTKEICNDTENKININSVDSNSNSNHIEFKIFDRLAHMVDPKKTVMCIDMYDIKQVNFKKKSKIDPSQLLFQSKQRRNVMSPQPRITMMGFSKDAFFSKRKGILKPGLQLKRVNVFADFSRKYKDFCKQLNEKDSIHIYNKEKLGSYEECESSTCIDVNMSNAKLKLYFK